MAVEAIAIIPARGGSKGVTKKNLRVIGGLPLIARTVRSALKAARISAVYVSTDDDQIADVARAYGAIAIARPAELSDDRAASEFAILHALKHLETLGVVPTITVFLQCTSPFTTAKQIDAVVSAVESTGAASAFAAIPDHSFLWTAANTGFAQGVNHDENAPRKRRQELAPQYREAGSIYAFRTNDFVRAGHRFCAPTVLVPVEGPSFEIDSEQDLQLCQAWSSLTEASEHFSLPPFIDALVMDFDGVITDDRVLVSESGTETVICSRSDGLGISLLLATGIQLLILSKERNGVVLARAAKLGIPALSGIDDKKPHLQHWLETRSISAANTIYLGNDLNDIPCMLSVGWPIAPADAHPAVREIARYVTAKSGGRGAVREVAELLHKAKNAPSTWPE